MERVKFGLIGFLVLVLAGCATPGSMSSNSDSGSSMDGSVVDDAAATYEMGMDGSNNLEAMSDDSMSQDLETIIYFDFDRS